MSVGNWYVFSFLFLSPVVPDDHFRINIRWKLPAEFFLDDIKWLFLTFHLFFHCNDAEFDKAFADLAQMTRQGMRQHNFLISDSLSISRDEVALGSDISHE